MGYKIRAARKDKLDRLMVEGSPNTMDDIARTIVRDLLNVNGKKKEKVI